MGANKKIDLYYLVFDDDDTAENTHKSKVKISGCECHILYFNPKEFYDVDCNSFNKDDFIKSIQDISLAKNISLIVTDWNILPPTEDFKGICGWDIIKYVIEAKNKLKDKTFLIYSANLEKVSEYIVKHIQKEIAEGNTELIISKDFINKLLELKIKFCNRSEQRFDEIKTLLNNSNTISNIVLNTIQSYDKNIINMGNDYFDGKKISDILSDIEPNIHGLKFIREFIELSIAHFTELNDD